MPADWIIKQGDSQPSFSDTLQYSDGTVPPLEGATLTLRVRSLTNAALTTLSGGTQIINPNTGEVLYTPVVADTATSGNYLAEWVVDFAPGLGLGQQTFPTDGYIWIFVEPNTANLAQSIVDLGALKRYLNIQGSDKTRDAEMLDWINAVTPLLEAEVGPLVPRVYEEWHDGGSNVITLQHDPSMGMGTNPVLQLIAASEYRGPIEYPLALVASPTFGSIYSVQLVKDYASITRRSAGGRTIAFMPGRESVHVWYQVGQNPIPANIQRAAMEMIRTLYRWPQATGRGSLSPADSMEMGGMLSAELARVIRTWLKPTKRYPSIG